MEPEPINQFFALFGVDPQVAGALAVLTFTLVEAAKKKLGAIIDGVKTDILSILIAFGLSVKTIAPQSGEQWWSVGVLTLAVWLFGVGVHAKTKGNTP
jgi:hypothetical protein